MKRLSAIFDAFAPLLAACPQLARGSRPETRTAVAAAMMLCALSMLGLAAPAPEAPYEVGQFWEYSHEGPRPGAMEPRAIDGRRIVRVIETVGAGAEQRWVIEERFTNDPKSVYRLHVRADGMLAAIVIEDENGRSMALTYGKPMPYQRVNMKVGDSVQIETALIMQPGGYKLPWTITITRLGNETLDAPAGRFADCRVYRSVTDSVLDIKVAKVNIKEHRQWWYSDRAHATVKEVYSKDAVKFLAFSQGKYSSTSTLAAFGVRAVSEAERAAVVRDLKTLAVAPPVRVQTHGHWKWIAPLAACTAAAAIGLRLFRKTRAPRRQM